MNLWMIHFKMIWFDKFLELFEELVEIYLMEHYYFKDYLIKFQMDFDLFKYFILKWNLKKKIFLTLDLIRGKADQNRWSKQKRENQSFDIRRNRRHISAWLRSAVF